MCGIVGYLGKFSKNKGLDVVQKMNNEIIHRGPDDFGSFVEENIAFGMRRLSIVDIGGGHQPIFSDDNNYSIVFNGEIYNHVELREDLQKKDIEFNTKSDTEVILKSYMHYGLDFIRKLNGMFSFFILDKKKNKSFLFRDRIGIKPLYYYHNHHNNDFLFASEVKSITASGCYEKKLNYQSMNDYLTLRYTDAQHSIWSDIHKLEAGHYVEYDLSTMNFLVKQYWNFEFNNSILKTDKEYQDEFKELFEDSVEKRIISSDVPVGLFLSGGLDSSMIAATAVKLGHKNFHTFSVGFEDDRGENELSYAKTMAEFIQSKHHEVIITKEDFINFLPELVYYTDEPYADLTSIPLYFLSQEASKHVKVVLSGEGADELFAGYNLNTTKNSFDSLKKIENLKHFFFLLKPFVSSKHKDTLNNIQEFSVKRLLEKRSSYMTKYWNDTEKEQLFGKSFNSTNDLISSLYQKTKSSDAIDQILDSYCRLWLVEDLLMKADKMTMANSLEARVPFLDHRLIEFASSLPTHLKVTKNTTKYILREYAKDIIPDTILNRPKKGFSIPVYKWLHDELNEWAKDLIINSEELEILNKELVLQEFNNLNDNIDSAHKIWIIIILHFWLQRWSTNIEKKSIIY